MGWDVSFRKNGLVGDNVHFQETSSKYTLAFFVVVNSQPRIFFHRFFFFKERVEGSERQREKH